MPAPPLPHPTPHTCPNCGAALTQRAEFCPSCGARLETKAARSIGWFAGTFALAVGTLVFGAIGACSAWTAGSVLLGGNSDNLVPTFLAVSLPLLLVGAIAAWGCGRALIKRLRE